MIQEIDADLLEYPLQGIIHQSNCFHTFGSGIAKLIREKYPEAFDADLKSGTKGDSHRLGSYSVAHVLKEDKYIFNLYGQYNYGALARFTSYDSIDRGLRKIEIYARDNNLSTLGLPKNMGCVRGGGSWRIVRAIIEDIFADNAIELYICNYDGG